LDVFDRFGNSPLDDAIRSKRDVCAKLLVEAGASLSPGHSADSWGYNLCMNAANGDLDQVRRLVNANVFVNARDYDGRTALHLAAASGRQRVVEFLVERGADISAQDRWQETPLHEAVRNGHSGIVAYLKSRGAQQAPSLHVPARIATAKPKRVNVFLVDPLSKQRSAMKSVAVDSDVSMSQFLQAASSKLGSSAVAVRARNHVGAEVDDPRLVYEDEILELELPPAQQPQP